MLLTAKVGRERRSNQWIRMISWRGSRMLIFSFLICLLNKQKHTLAEYSPCIIIGYIFKYGVLWNHLNRQKDKAGAGDKREEKNILELGENVFELILNLSGRCQKVSLEKYVSHIRVRFAWYVKKFRLRRFQKSI